MDFLNKVFHLEEANTNVKRELIAALTTFVSLSYIHRYSNWLFPDGLYCKLPYCLSSNSR